MFCASTTSIVSGALTERIKLWPFLVYVIILVVVIYPIQASWKWGGGFLNDMGFQDFTSSTFVHSVSGWAALTGAIFFSLRLGEYKGGKVNPMPGSNLALATLGIFILWLSWFGFNSCSQLYMDTSGSVADISSIFSNTNTVAAAGAVAALTLTPSLIQSTMIGTVSGIIVVFAMPMLDRMKIDYVVDAISVHLFAAIWGTLAVYFTNSAATFSVQLTSTLIVGAFVTVTTAFVWLVLKATAGLRVSEEVEIMSLGRNGLAVEAYPEFSSS